MTQSTKYRRWDVLEVVWLDAQYDGDFDQEVGDDKPTCHRLATLHTLGYYIESDAECLVLSFTKSLKDSAARWLIAIPRNAIKSIRVMKTGGNRGRTTP